MNETKNASVDTHYYMEWSEFIKIVKKIGFKQSLAQKFRGDLGVEEEEIIFFHEKGLILYADSFQGVVNTAQIYGEIIAPDEEFDSYWELLEGCSRGYKNGVIYFEMDARENVCKRLNEIEENAKFVRKWKVKQWISLINYKEREEIKSDLRLLDKIIKTKISTCTPEVREIIFGE